MKCINWKHITYLLIVSVLFYVSCQSAKPIPQVEQLIPVKVAPLQRQVVSIPVHTSGRLYPSVAAKLSFKTGGIIANIRVDEGQSVKKGQLLAALELSEINAKVKQAKNGYQKALRDKQRVQNLYNDRASTLEQLQNVTTALEVAQANLDIANFNLKHSQIHAPANGKILKRMEEPNQMIAAGYPVFLFGSTDNRWVVKVGVSLRDVVKLKLQDRGQITFDAYGEKQFESIVTEVSESVDPASGTCEVELELAKDEQIKWIAGLIAAVDIFPSDKREYLKIPIDALVEAEGSEGYVFTVRDNKAYKVKLTIVHLKEDYALALETNEKLTKVVTEGAPYLTDGKKVNIVSERENSKSEIRNPKQIPNPNVPNSKPLS
jgi:membrane fusion protein, multidrug efflux system